VARDQVRVRWTRDITPRLAFLLGLRGSHDEDIREFSAFRPRSYATGDIGMQWHWEEEFSLRASYEYTWQKFDDALVDPATSSGASALPFSINPCNVDAEGHTMEPRHTEFSDYVHAIGRRKALMIGVAIPIAVLAVLLSLTLAGHIHIVRAGRDRREVRRPGSGE
jgi:hypothetical protein